MGFHGRTHLVLVGHELNVHMTRVPISKLLEVFCSRTEDDATPSRSWMSPSSPNKFLNLKVSWNTVQATLGLLIDHILVVRMVSGSRADCLP